ncbi:MAG: hypothetical protein R3F56_21810 [Planctomycetota bacterium]
MSLDGGACAGRIADGMTTRGTAARRRNLGGRDAATRAPADSRKEGGTSTRKTIANTGVAPKKGSSRRTRDYSTTDHSITHHSTTDHSTTEYWASKSTHPPRTLVVHDATGVGGLIGIAVVMACFFAAALLF